MDTHYARRGGNKKMRGRSKPLPKTGSTSAIPGYKKGGATKGKK